MVESNVCDVFVTHAEAGAVRAARIAYQCRVEGLAAVTHAELSASLEVGNEVWNALMESRAVILVLPTGELTAVMTFVLGAAWGGGKPVYGLLADRDAKYEGPMKAKVEFYPQERIADVIHAIKTVAKEFGDHDRNLLKKLYAEASATVDQMATGSTELDALIEAFARETGRRVDGDRLLSELFRMRKQGKLPRRRRAAGRSAV